MRALRVAAVRELVRDQETRSSGAPLVYCLGYVRILGEDPPIWEVADEDPEGLAALASLHAPVAPASTCDTHPVLGPDGRPVARSVRLTVERIDILEPTVAVVRVAVWTKDRTAPATRARGQGWAVRLVRVTGGWEVESRERTWTGEYSSMRSRTGPGGPHTSAQLPSISLTRPSSRSFSRIASVLRSARYGGAVGVSA